MNDIDTNSITTKSGYVAIIGRPNVGKSTLLNKIVGQKLSITSRKPQTTRNRILGIQTIDNVQIIYIDTPGIHEGEKIALNKYMNKEARAALREVDVVLFMIESTRWLAEDELVLNLLSHITVPILLVVNKVDMLSEKEWLLPHIEQLTKKHAFTEIIPISAKKGSNLLKLQKTITDLMPIGPHYFPLGQITDKTIRFQISEIIREKLTRFLSKELPYSIMIEIESFIKEEKIIKIHAIIWVERESQKPIVIGEGGIRLREIGRRARINIENLLGQKVFLKLWVKVKANWSDDIRALHSLGLNDEL